MSVTQSMRHSKANRCPICDGAEGDPRGKGKRCSGFTSTDGEYAHCTSDEHAGSLSPDNASPPTFAHKMHGDCRCGTSHGAARISQIRSSIVATYPYTDEHGKLLFEVVRMSPKTFRQRRPNGAGGWEWNMQGVKRVLYRLPELLADDGDRPVFVCEGEKDCDALAALGHTATTNPGGAGKWAAVAAQAREVLAGRDVVVIADGDKVGREHARQVAGSLKGAAASVVVRECPGHKDVSDLLAAGGTLDQLLDLQGETETESEPADERDTAPEPSAWIHRVTTIPDDWYVTPPAKRVYLLRDARRDGAGYLPLGRVGQAIAEGGGGKTMACAIQLSVAVATGTRWLGTFEVSTQGRALLLLGEEDDDEVRRRLYRARRAANAPMPPEGSIVCHALTGMPVSMVDRDQRGNWIDSPYLIELRAWIAEHGPWALVVVDPLSRFAGADAEVDNAAATRFTVALESLAPGATTLSLHHTNKLSRNTNGEITASAGRGSSAFVDGARWQAAMGVERLNFEDPDIRARLGEIVVLAHTKSNYSRKAAPLLLRRDLDNGGALLPLDAEDLEMVAAARAGAEPRRARSAEREAERDRTLAERETKEAALRATREAARVAEVRQRTTDDDDAVRALISGAPGISYRDLTAATMARRACGTARAEAAIRRVRMTEERTQ